MTRETGLSLWAELAADAESTGTETARLGAIRARCLLAGGHATGHPPEVLARVASPPVTPDLSAGPVPAEPVTVPGDTGITAGQGATGHALVTSGVTP